MVASDPWIPWNPWNTLDFFPALENFLETLEKSILFWGPLKSKIYTLETLEISNFQAIFSHFNFQKYKIFPTAWDTNISELNEKTSLGTPEIQGVIPRSFLRGLPFNL